MISRLLPSFSPRPRFFLDADLGGFATNARRLHVRFSRVRARFLVCVFSGACWCACFVCSCVLVLVISRVCFLVLVCARLSNLYPPRTLIGWSCVGRDWSSGFCSAGAPLEACARRMLWKSSPMYGFLIFWGFFVVTGKRMYARCT